MDPGEHNLRRYPRYELETELRVTTEHRETRGRSLNLNQGGVAGVFATGWEVGTRVKIQFSVPVAATVIQAGAIVRNHTDHRYGFEFVDLVPEQRETIGRTCTTLSLLQ